VVSDAKSNPILSILVLVIFPTLSLDILTSEPAPVLVIIVVIPGTS